MKQRLRQRGWLLRAVAVLSVLSVGCSDDHPPLAPSPVPSLPQLSGSYTMTLTPCELPQGNEAVSGFPIGPYTSKWTFTQQGDLITGRFSASSPPAVSSGTLTASVDLSGRIVLDSLRFSWSSSHVGLLQFAGSGDGFADKTQISGNVSGEESWTTPFGVSRYTCNGTRMPFSFTLLSTSPS